MTYALSSKKIGFNMLRTIIILMLLLAVAGCNAPPADLQPAIQPSGQGCSINVADGRFMDLGVFQIKIMEAL